MWSVVFAVVHLLALVFGVAVLVLRAKALSVAHEQHDVGPVLFWDNVYGLLAIVWMGSGVVRAFGGLEKGTAYYLHQPLFHLKMTLLVVLLAAESLPMITFIRWRIARAKRNPVSLDKKGTLVRLHWVELGAIAGVVVAASLMARGVGASHRSNASPASAQVTSPDGAALYERHCRTCHQADGRGQGGLLAADFVGDSKRLSKPDADLLRSIRDGVPNSAMPSFRDRLSEAEMEATLRHVRAAFGR